MFSGVVPSTHEELDQVDLCPVDRSQHLSELGLTECAWHVWLECLGYYLTQKIALNLGA